MERTRDAQVELLSQEAAHKLELRMYRIQNSVWLFFAFASVVACLAFVFDEETRKQTATYYQLDQTYQYAWNVSWGIGGILVFWGVWFWRSRVEVIGHIFFGGAIFTSCLAIFLTVREFVPTLLTLLSFTAASFFRAWWILRILPKRSETQ